MKVEASLHYTIGQMKRLLMTAVIFLFLFPSKGEGLTTKLYPADPLQGDLCLLKINSAAAPEVSFMGKGVMLYSTAPGESMALLPIPVDTPPGRYAVTLEEGEKKTTIFLTIRQRRVPPVHLSLPPEKVKPGPEAMKRIERERRMLSRLWRRQTPPKWAGPFIAPVQSEITSVFGIPRIMNGIRKSIHRGMDYRAPEGTQVRALNSGQVVLAEDLYFGGKTLIIDHGGGIYSVYMHLSAFLKSPGDRVKKGEAVGLSGKSGRATGPHLHLSVKAGGISVDPASLYSLPF